VIANRANTTVVNLGGNTYTIEKTGGVGGPTTPAPCRRSASAGDFVLRIKHARPAGNYFVGA
jgi:hypothetical protein